MTGTNCWEHRKCGKEKECPAYPNRGWECWNVEATLCRGDVQGTYDQKIGSCRTLCPYYNAVMSGSVKMT